MPPGPLRSESTKPQHQSKSERTAVLYLRVSSTGQVNTAHDPEGYSIPSQREACQRHAKSLGAKVIAEYVEPGRSATTTNRPALQQMLAEIGETQPDFVIFYDLSRAARDEYDALWLLREITALGSKLESTQERVDDSESGMLLYTIMSGVNAFRSRNDGKKIKAGVQKKFEAGGTTGPARLGYLNVREQVDGHDVAAIALDPDRWPLIRMGFDLMLTGQHTVSSVTDVLQDAGLTSRPSARRPSKPLGRASIHKILTNDYYAGIVTRHGEKRPGRHEAIVTEEEFDLVQRIMSSHTFGAARGSKKHHHYLSGQLICSRCGCRMGYSRNRGRHGGYYEYFTCLSRVHKGGPCGAKYVPLPAIERELEEIHRRLVLTDTDKEAVRRAARETIEKRVRKAREQASIHANRVDSLTAQQQKLIELYYEDAISVEVLKSEQARIKQEKHDAERWRAGAEIKVNSVMRALELTLEKVDDYESAYDALPPHERRLLNGSLFAYILVDGFDGDSGRSGAEISETKQLSPALDLTLASAVQVARSKTPPASAGAWQIPEGWFANAVPSETKNPASVENRERGSNNYKLVPPRGFEPRFPP